ncbi:PPA1309 family protein [Nocardioides caldifontis]|uniref:PPA1309 family protein n=1 Tax=Nocardioides caldifontis TaxID=2588938 RepID=UPI001EF14CFD|nr:PPA1309 family protein [Nocardioides caldifontis]
MTDIPYDPNSDQVPAGPDGAPLEPAADLALRGVVLELERHVAGGGWDQPPRMYALVLTEELLSAEPGLADAIGVDPSADLTGSLTPIEQEPLDDAGALEELLTQIVWPSEVHGTAVAVERIVVPPTVELPEDEDEAREVATNHPEAQEVRMVAAATRTGSTYCALRLRSHDDDLSVVEGPDLVPALLELLQATLVADEQ